jgi:hypothetical protein
MEIHGITLPQILELQTTKSTTSIVTPLPPRSFPHLKLLSADMEYLATGIMSRVMFDSLEGVIVKNRIVWVTLDDGMSFHALAELAASHDCFNLGETIVVESYLCDPNIVDPEIIALITSYLLDYPLRYQLHLFMRENVCDPLIVDPEVAA